MECYERLRVLGRGSFGTALLVRKKRRGRATGEPLELSEDGQLRVIKEIDLSQLSTASRCEARTEAEVLQSLSHVNIVAHVETFLDADRLCIVMEFADGGDLGTIVEEQKDVGGHFAEAEVMATFVQCCLGLHHTHAYRVLHRDLKSRNIFVTKAGTVKLGDFGISKILDHTTAQARTHLGTPHYVSPEIVDNQPYGLKADIWALGVVLYELLALELPFRGRNLVTLVLRILQAEAPALPDAYSESTVAVVGQLLQKNPEKRPTCDELLAFPAMCIAAASLPRQLPVRPLPISKKTGLERDRPCSCGTLPTLPGSEAFPSSWGPNMEGSLPSDPADCVDELLGPLESHYGITCLEKHTSSEDMLCVRSSLGNPMQLAQSDSPHATANACAIVSADLQPILPSCNVAPAQAPVVVKALVEQRSQEMHAHELALHWELNTHLREDHNPTDLECLTDGSSASRHARQSPERRRRRRHRRSQAEIMPILCGAASDGEMEATARSGMCLDTILQLLASEIVSPQRIRHSKSDASHMHQSGRMDDGFAGSLEPQPTITDVSGESGHVAAPVLIPPMTSALAPPNCEMEAVPYSKDALEIFEDSPKAPRHRRRVSWGREVESAARRRSSKSSSSGSAIEDSAAPREARIAYRTNSRSPPRAPYLLPPLPHLLSPRLAVMPEGGGEFSTALPSTKSTPRRNNKASPSSARIPEVISPAGKPAAPTAAITCKEWSFRNARRAISGPQKNAADARTTIGKMGRTASMPIMADSLGAAGESARKRKETPITTPISSSRRNAPSVPMAPKGCMPSWRSAQMARKLSD
jgi:serine/threonine protein kinase